MSKLIYRTKPPRKGYVKYQSFMTHETKGIRDKLPSQETQTKAHDLVQDTLGKLITELEKMGYDQTKVGFYIHYQNL
ncbi:hypothetical protein J0383_07900 [Flavobacterium endoglycinae]|uniref:HU domain-containing protein n=1 Tax=Flavobacterium endoglycinae TaxID=2816357 RepID=A0ABX7QI19_9FLAO|nr:hypothetical protein [Flavobacterium endoglycinae]QSW90722.1 hypothetical protein J0383_07900 [Flavobacterium endoglycinae]